jgi:hypothetical protein
MARNSTGSRVHQVVLVERYFSALTPHRLAQLALHTQAVAARETGHGVRVAYVGSAAVPEDETCFCLFVADSMAAVERVNRRLVVPSVRIASALVVGPLRPIATEIRTR